MFGTKRQFGRNLSNVQRPALSTKQQPPLKKARTQAEIPTAVAKPTTRTRAAASKSTAAVRRRPAATKSQTSLLEHYGAPAETVAPAWSGEMNPCEDVSDNEMDDAMSIDMTGPAVEHEDIDRYDTHDPQFVSEYINDIMAFLREKELAHQISHDYCDRQQEIKPRQRNHLIRWMAEVYVQLKLLAETYFLAVNIVDQVLDNCLVSRKKIHLIGVAAMFIASKYEETWAPPLNDLLVCCDYAFTDKDILRMEREILNRIDFNLAIPAPIHFLRRYSKAGHSDGLTHTIAKFLTEMTCQSYAMLQFLPSQIAAAAVLMARQIQGGYDELWDNNLRFYSGYEAQDLVQCGQTLTMCILKELRSNRGTCAVIRKYSDTKLLGVAKTVIRVLTQGQ